MGLGEMGGHPYVIGFDVARIYVHGLRGTLKADERAEMLEGPENAWSELESASAKC